MLYISEPLDGLGTIHTGFYPPNSTEEWPQSIGDIGDCEMKELLQQAGHNAKGGMFPRITYLTISSAGWCHIHR
jgi:hypothetical protein